MSTNANRQWRQTQTTRLALALGLAVLVWAPRPAPATQVLFNPTFENDTTNGNARVALGTAPAFWSSTQTLETDGSMADVCVVTGGSPFAGGSTKSMLLYDNTTQTPRIDCAQGFTTPNSRPVTVSFEVQFNSAVTGSQLDFRVRGPADNGVYFVPSGSQMVAVDLNGGSLGYDLNVGTWYRVVMAFPPVSSLGSQYSISITDFQTLTTQTFPGVFHPGSGSTGFNEVRMNSSFSTPGLLDANVDNITVDVIPEPASLALLGIGGLILYWQRRRSV